MRPGLAFVVVLVLLTTGLSSFADTSEVKKDEPVKDASDDKSDSTESKEDSREKRSDEDIMFGNQQNKANGLVDDILSMSDTSKSEEDGDSKNDTKKKDDESKSEEDASASTQKTEEKRNLEEDSNSAMGDSGSDGSEVSSRWYSSNPVSSEALQYLFTSPPLQTMGPAESFVDVGGMYDQRDIMYRRKRQLRPRPFTLMKRSLRSPIGEMIHSRSPRLPRRSMRLKRQVNVEDLLSLIRNAESNNGAATYYKPVPGRLNNLHFQESGYGYPYGMGSEGENMQSEEENEVPEGLQYRPSSGYLDLPSYSPSQFRARAEESESVPQWKERSVPQPSIFTVSRRSTPVFYPIDYRYIPGYKKRSLVDEPDEPESSFGKWGRVVQVPEAYASPEDVARLYALANLLAENETPEVRKRRSA